MRRVGGVRCEGVWRGCEGVWRGWEGVRCEGRVEGGRV